METRTAFRDETERLLRLGDDLRGLLEPADKQAFEQWRAAVETVRDGGAVEAPQEEAAAGPEDAVLDPEWRLEQLTAELRSLWLQRAYRCSTRQYRSPYMGGGVPLLPSGAPVSFSYERNVQAHALEEKLAAGPRVPRDWSAARVSYANGMAAITGFLQTYQKMVLTGDGGPLRLAVWGSYFETDVLLELLGGRAYQVERPATQAELHRIVSEGSADVLLVEAVRYDWDLEPLDLRGLVAAWHARPGGRPGALVLDTTLVATAWPTEAVLSALSACSTDLVVETRSGLKLDQQGLELANIGVTTVYTPHGASPGATGIASVLRKMRTITGTGLDLNALAALDAPFALAHDRTREHSQAVFLNNALTATALARRPGLFSRVAHPALVGDRRPWSQAPFVVCHLAEDTLEHHGLLLAVVDEEARRRGLCLVRGSSFGFRGHRYETIVPKLSEQRGLFKIAMGSRAGPARDAVIGLFTELAAFPDAAALRAAYPDVVPVSLTNLEA